MTYYKVIYTKKHNQVYTYIMTVKKSYKHVRSVRLDASVYNEKRWPVFIYFNPSINVRKKLR